MQKREFEKSLNLTNDGKLSLFFIGTGTAFSKTYFQTNLLVVKGNQHILIDCGGLCAYVLDSKYNFKMKNIKNLLVTHPHADHIGGLEEIGFTSYYLNKSKINIIITDKFKKILWKDSLRGGMQFSENGKMHFEDYFCQYKPTLIIKKPFPIWEIDFNGINIKLFRTYHVTCKQHSLKGAQYSVGLILDNKILFTADTQFAPEQLAWICSNYNIEAIFHDCDMSGFSIGVHAGYEQLKTLSQEIKSKIYLCHYSYNAHNTDITKDGFAGFAEPGIYYDF